MALDEDYLIQDVGSTEFNELKKRESRLLELSATNLPGLVPIRVSLKYNQQRRTLGFYNGDTFQIIIDPTDLKNEKEVEYMDALYQNSITKLEKIRMREEDWVYEADPTKDPGDPIKKPSNSNNSDLNDDIPF